MEKDVEEEDLVRKIGGDHNLCEWKDPSSIAQPAAFSSIPQVSLSPASAVSLVMPISEASGAVTHFKCSLTILPRQKLGRKSKPTDVNSSSLQVPPETSAQAI
jgi:hypothetical protein